MTKEADILKILIERVKQIAFSMPAPNEYTPLLVRAATEAEVARLQAGFTSGVVIAFDPDQNAWVTRKLS